MAAPTPPPPEEDIARDAPPARVGPRAVVTHVSASELIGMLKSRKELRALTAETGLARFAHLVPAFQEKTREEDLWEVEGVNDAGLVRMVTLSFVPAQQATQQGSWAFRSVAVRLRSEDPRRTFAEIRKAANATFKKVKWLDLSDRDRSAWNMGEHWELVAGVLEEGDIYVRAGRPPRP